MSNETCLLAVAITDCVIYFKRASIKLYGPHSSKEEVAVSAKFASLGMAMAATDLVALGTRPCEYRINEVHVHLFVGIEVDIKDHWEQGAATVSLPVLAS